MQSSGKIRRESIDRLLSHVNLVDYLQGYVELRRTGGHYSGKCPFHADSTPSFIVDEKHYHCFGCRAHGNLIDFEIHRSGGTFPEAVKALAERYGVEVSYEEGTERREDAATAERKRLLHIMVETASIYAKNLRSQEGKEAVAYLVNRGFTLEHLTAWEIGLAPRNNLLVGLARQRGWRIEDLVRLGLVKKNEERNEHFDFFRSRIMIPIKDERGAVVAFGGRIYQAFPPDRTPPKYLNSPETELFSKSRLLFNFHRARASIMQSQAAIVVEGYMDCIALVNAGITNAVAVLGTALTQEHVRRLSRVTRQAVLCFDSDKAGREAARRSFEVAYPLNLMDLQYTSVPHGKDPDEFVRKEGAEAFRALAAQGQSLTTWVCEQYIAAAKTREMAVRTIKTQMVPIVEKNPDGAQRETAFSLMAEKLGLSSHSGLLSTGQPRPVLSKGVQGTSERRGATAGGRFAGAAQEDSEGRKDAGPASDSGEAALRWEIRRLEELRFLLCLVFVAPHELCPRLKNLLDGTLSEEELDERIAAQTIVESLTLDSQRLVKELFSTMATAGGRRLRELEASQTRNLLSDEARALIALAAVDVETLAELDLDVWLKNSQGPSSFRSYENVFDERNSAYVRSLVMKDLEISSRNGALSAELNRVLLKLETAYLDAQFDKILTEIKQATAFAMADEVVEGLRARCKKISAERERRVQKFGGR